MIGRSLVAMIGLAMMAAPAFAQPLFSNPFSTAAAYRTERGDLSEAHYRLRYEATTSRPGAQAATREIIIDVAPDWSLTRDGARTLLRDFRLNRVFTLEDGAFSTMNGMAELTFRVMERQNRTFVNGIMAAATKQPASSGECGADAELGLALPGKLTAAQFLDQQGAFVMTCGGRDSGGFTPGTGDAPPAAFWPTLNNTFMLHPALFSRMQQAGRAPSRIEAAFEGPGGETRQTWRLLAVETVATPYPLPEASHNKTADTLDQLIAAGAGQLAVDTLAGKALGGTPTPQSWGEHLNAVSQRDGQAAAALLLMPTLNMFPDLMATCATAQPHPVCALSKGLAAIAKADPAPMSILELGMAEQRRDTDAGIAAMKRAQASPNRDNPALGASFALLLISIDQKGLEKVRAAKLPTDVAALQARAVMALPYNPAYWTDIGDRYGSAYRWTDAFVFYDVAFSLPMPSAIAGNRALTGKRDVYTRIRKDFPGAFLPG